MRHPRTRNHRARLATTRTLLLLMRDHLGRFTRIRATVATPAPARTRVRRRLLAVPAVQLALF